MTWETKQFIRPGEEINIQVSDLIFLYFHLVLPPHHGSSFSAYDFTILFPLPAFFLPQYVFIYIVQEGIVAGQHCPLLFMPFTVLGLIFYFLFLFHFYFFFTSVFLYSFLLLLLHHPKLRGLLGLQFGGTYLYLIYLVYH